MDPGASSGAVDYGASVGSGTVRYGLTPALTVEGQMQSAPTLTTRGMGTTYQAGDYGTIQAGATQAPSTRSTPGATASATTSTCPENLNLGYTSEQIGAGFGDLSNYGGGGGHRADPQHAVRRRAHPWLGHAQRHLFRLARRHHAVIAARRPGAQHVRGADRAAGADRDILTGNYEWRANLSMPVDTFMRGTWLQW